MKIAFITDGGLDVGMGHVLQATTLAKLLEDKAEIYFITKSDKNIIDKIEDEGFTAIKFDNDSKILRYLQLLKPDRIIIDKIDVDEKFAKQIKEELRVKLVIFTNITPANKYASIAVTADIGSQFRNLKFVDENTKTLFFYGPKYWILREEFYQLRGNKKIKQAIIKKILLIFGGSDPANVTSAVLNELLAQEIEYQIDVILGASFGHIEDINCILDKHKGRSNNITLYRNTKRVARLMYSADLVIASPGLSCFEALCVGTPLLIIPQNNLQKVTYQGFFNLVNRSETNKLRSLIEKKDFTYPESEFVKELEIGEGRMEIVDEILR